MELSVTRRVRICAPSLKHAHEYTLIITETINDKPATNGQL
jgi:hypothetical protein